MKLPCCRPQTKNLSTFIAFHNTNNLRAKKTIPLISIGYKIKVHFWAAKRQGGKQGNRKQETGNRKQETGNRKQETGNRKQETGNRKVYCAESPAQHL